MLTIPRPEATIPTVPPCKHLTCTNEQSYKVTHTPVVNRVPRQSAARRRDKSVCVCVCVCAAACVYVTMHRWLLHTKGLLTRVCQRSGGVETARYLPHAFPQKTVYHGGDVLVQHRRLPFAACFAAHTHGEV